MRCLLKCSIVKEYRLCRRKLFNKRLVLNLWIHQQFVRSLYWHRLLFTCLKRSIGRSYATQCFHLEMLLFRDARHTCYRHRENHWRVHRNSHDVYTRISNASYAGLIVQRSLLLSARIVTNGDSPAATLDRMNASTCRGRPHHKKIFVSSFLITH